MPVNCTKLHVYQCMTLRRPFTTKTDFFFFFFEVTPKTVLTS